MYKGLYTILITIYIVTTIAISLFFLLLPNVTLIKLSLTLPYLTLPVADFGF